jgi:type II secretory pathway predicted ATPase ExeA
MYAEFFHLTDLPFENALDPRFLFLSEIHKEVLAALLYFVRERKEFALVCGDVGTGKTMLINTFLAKLPESVRAVIISNPKVDYQEMLLYLAGCLGIAEPSDRVLKLMDQVKKALEEHNRQGIRYLLVIDEAHLLSDQDLEHIRLLSNMETPQDKLLPILLSGQNDLIAKLNQPEMHQLRQRININRFLAPLDSRETWRYVDHHLRVVGGTYESCFTSSCLRSIYKLTGGVPRCINHLCDNALLICKASEQPKVDRRILRKAQDSLCGEILFTQCAGTRKASFQKALKIAFEATPYVVLLVVLWILGQAGLLGQGVQRVVDGAFPTVLMAPEGDPGRPQSDTPRVTAVPEADVTGKLPSVESVSRQAPAPEPLPQEAESQPASQEIGQVERDRTPAIRKAFPDPTNSGAEVFREGANSPEPMGTFSREAGFNAAAGGPSPVSTQDKQSVDRLRKDASDSSAASPESVTTEPVTGQPLVEQDQGEPRRPSYVTVKKGETISIIARQWYPANPQAGVRAILQANPGIVNMNHIEPGQVLKLTESAP